ncbi:MAG TPA: glycosyltransferase [Anaerolineales bacterium]|jgi:vancomycin aglycone glucosyltransferase|nr:glycosyltransferase [Anaerolineales bacterium]
MRVLLSSIGTRGDVQPIVALGLELQALGHRARLVVPPNFKEWVESYGLESVPIGPDLKKLTGGTVTGKPVLPSKEQLQQMADQSVRDQFRVLGEAARDCDLIVAATALQFAARSIAKAQGIPYVFAAYCPAVLPSSKYPPPSHGNAGQAWGTGNSHSLSEAENLGLWKENEASFHKFAAALNEERAKIGLEPVTSVQRHMFTERPWLAADPVLAPAFPLDGMEVVQTGAWMFSAGTPLPDAVEEFLADGEPPVYLGFGSMRASDQTAHILIEAARVLGLRSILSQGWAGLTPGDTGEDVLSIPDVNHGKLFPRVAAIVHHGGAGTTHAAAKAATPQVIIPHNYDQFYWTHRVQGLGIGVSGPLRDDITVDNVAQALRQALQPEVRTRAQELAERIELNGAHIAAERLANEFD